MSYDKYEARFYNVSRRVFNAVSDRYAERHAADPKKFNGNIRYDGDRNDGSVTIVGYNEATYKWLLRVFYDEYVKI